MALTGAKVQTNVEVMKLDQEKKQVIAVDLATGAESTHTSDKLVIATGARPFVPECEGLGLENVFFMRTPDDADALRKKVDSGDLRIPGERHGGCGHYVLHRRSAGGHYQ